MTGGCVSGDPITDLDAHALSCAIHARELSCVEVMQAYLARIHRVNPRFNAIVNLADDDTLLAQAAQCDIELARGASRGWMHGMPQAIKDTGRYGNGAAGRRAGQMAEARRANTPFVRSFTQRPVPVNV